MDFESLGGDDLSRRLPLPLAQLHRRARNAVSSANRLNTAYCLWEASLKLLGSVAIVVYADRGEYSAEVAERLKNLARPALGHWWEFVRLLTQALAEAGDPGFRGIRDLLFGQVRHDMPRAAGLDSVLRSVLDGDAAVRGGVRLAQLFDRLVRFRNREIGHGPLGQQSAEYQDRVGGALLAGVVEILGRLDTMAGRRLVYVADVRRDPSGGWTVERFEMAGEASRRLRPLGFPAERAANLPRPDHVCFEAGGDGDLAVLQSLHPLVLCNHEQAEVFFLNARRGSRRAEYLCYHPGRVEERPDLGVERRELLARVLGVPVDGRQADSWAAQSESEDPPAFAASAAPSRRLGEFELLSELGRGGMGIVYRAWQPSLGRHVALKRLMNTGDAKAEARFSREIHALGRVDHPNLIKTYTSGSDGEYWFYAMELVEGATLAAICETIQQSCPGASRVDLDTWRASVSSACEQARQAERPIAATESDDFPRATEPRPARTPAQPRTVRGYARHVAELIRQTAEAAHALHESGVVHRDVKPGNIMVAAGGGQAVLMDLGLAQLADDVHGKLTRTRQFVGTLRYASPEQVLAVGGVDRRSDVYSLGASLWELLTLRPMFGATEQTPTPDLMQRIQYEDPEPVRHYHAGIERDLEAIVHKCLAKDPKRRYDAAADLADDLRRFLDGEPVRARRVHLAGRLWRRAWRRPAATALVLVVIVAAAVLSVVVPRVITAQRATDLTARLDDLIDRGGVAAAKLEEVDRLLAALARLEPRQAAARRDKVSKQLAERIASDIHSHPTLEPGDEARVKDEIRAFAARDLERSKDLEQLLAQRVRSWQEVARLSSPFDRVDPVFDPSRVVVEAGGVGLKFPGQEGGSAASTPSTFLPTRVPCLGNVQLEVTFRAGSWESADRIGLLLYDNQWHTGPMQNLVYDQAGERLIIVDEQGGIRLWDVRAHSPTTLPPPPAGSISLAFGLPGGKGAETPAAATPKLWDAVLGRALPEARSTRIGQVAAAVAPNGRAVALAGPGGIVRFFTHQDGSLTPAREFPLARRDILSLALAGDGKRIAVGTRDGAVILLDPASTEPPAVLNGHLGEVAALAFDRAGGLLASGGADTKVHLWDVAKHAQKSVLSGHQGKVTRLTFSPDGRTLASGGVDAQVRLWNLDTGQAPSPLTAHNAPISGLAFSPDQAALAVAYNRWLTIWDLKSSQPRETLRPRNYALQLLGERPVRAISAAWAPSTRRTVGDTIAAGRPVVVELLRDEQILREQAVNLPAQGTIALSATLEGGRLELKVDGTSVLFQDLFTLGRTAKGVFGLDLPSTARIEQLSASCQRPPERPSLIEQGDEFFAEGQFAKAADSYRKQREDAADPQVVQEARCKEGVCFEFLNRHEQAIRLFEQVLAEEGDRWPIIAGCRLWRLHLEMRNPDEAYPIYMRLSANRRLDRIHEFVPADIPASIIKAYAPDTAYSHIIRNPKLVSDLELARAIARDVHAGGDQQARIQNLLAQAYHEDQQLARAEAAYAELLAGAPLSNSEEGIILDNYFWVLGQGKRDQDALNEADRRLAAGSGANPFILLCRARVRERRRDWAGAKSDVDEFLLRPESKMTYWLYETCLIQGFSREALGDAAGARESWRRGYLAASGTGDMARLSVAIMASLSGAITEADSRLMFNTVVGGMPSNVPGMKLIENFQFRFEDVVSALRTMWSTPRGREYARKIALLDGTVTELNEIQVPLSVTEFCRYGAFGGTPSPEDDDLVWLMAQNLFRDYRDRKLNDANMIQVLIAWFGYNIRLAWPLAAGAMRPETRGPTAYVLGARYQLLGKPEIARSFFQTAVNDSASNATLRRRAQSRLDLLKAAK